MKNKENNNMSKSELLNPQGLFVCSVCGKEFKADDDTRYIINNGYTCSWKCFLTESTKKSEERKSVDKNKKRVKN